MYIFAFHETLIQKVSAFFEMKSKKYNLKWQLENQGNNIIVVRITRINTVYLSRSIYTFSRQIENESLKITTKNSIFYTPKAEIIEPVLVHINDPKPLFHKSYLYTICELEKAEIHFDLPKQKHSKFSQVIISKYSFETAKEKIFKQSKEELCLSF